MAQNRPTPKKKRKRSRGPRRVADAANPPASNTGWTDRRITIAGIVVTVLALIVGGISMTSDVTGWLARAPADLRLTLHQPSDVLAMLPEAPIRREGDHLIQTMSATFKFRVTNLSRTPGFVDRVELVPATPDTGAVEQIISITKREVNRGTEQLVEVSARIKTRMEAVGPAEEQQAYEYYLRPFDDRGRLIERYENGLHARIHFSGRHKTQRKLIPAR